MINLSKPAEVLLVEDNADDELLALRAISKAGIACNVTVRRDGAQAIDRLLGETSPPHLVILDYNLPRFNGLEVLKCLRGHSKTTHVPVVMFSGTNNGDDLVECYLHGANSCVAKPNDPKAYVECLSWITHYWLQLNQVARSN